jgi:hypothetical protein
MGALVAYFASNFTGPVKVFFNFPESVPQGKENIGKLQHTGNEQSARSLLRANLK